MRVLFLTEERITFSGSMVRGGQIHVRNVVEGLRARGHEVQLIDRNTTAERSYQHSVDPWLRFVVDPARILGRALRCGRTWGADVVISKTRKTYLPGLAAARFLGVPHIVHVGSSPNPIGQGLGERLDAASVIARLKAPHDGYFAVCDAIAAELEQRGIDGTRIYDIKNAVDTDQFHPAGPPVELDESYQHQLDAMATDSFRLGYVGGLYSYKGVADLAAACEETSVECSVIVVGDGPARAGLERRFGDTAIFLGSVPYEQVPAVYHELDAFVLPSYTEGLPRVVLEAQATGTPVIASNVGGIPEVVQNGETGLLCDPGSRTCLAEAIERLETDRELRVQLSKRGRRSIASYYTWDQMYDRYDRLLTAIIDEQIST